MTRVLRLVSHVPDGPPTTIAPRALAMDHGILAALGAGAAAERLRDSRALAVTTGQQPGLFGGPLYVVHKALAALAVARRLEEGWGRPVVPVFWLAGDDHDWIEASHAAWWTGRETVREWQLPARPADAPQRPMSREPVPATITAARDALAADLPAGPDREHALAWVDRHWRTGHSMATAFAGAMRELLEPLGIACIDPTEPTFKRAQAPLIAAALEHSDVIDATLAAAPDPGTGIAAGDGATLVFLEAIAGRDRLVREGPDSFVTRRSAERFTMAALRDMLDGEPERFSANVLLRPVIEAALLPTVAYVAGPGERRYLVHQAALVYPHLDIVPQAVVPRWGATVVDPTTESLLERLGVGAEEVIRGEQGFERLLLLRDMPDEVGDALATLREAIEGAQATLSHAGVAIDPVLERAVTARANRLRHVSADLENLMERHLKKRDDIAWAQYQRLRARLRPHGAPQERTIAVAAALGRWGTAWLEAGLASAMAWADTAVVPGGAGERG